MVSRSALKKRTRRRRRRRVDNKRRNNLRGGMRSRRWTLRRWLRGPEPEESRSRRHAETVLRNLRLGEQRLRVAQGVVRDKRAQGISGNSLQRALHAETLLAAEVDGLRRTVAQTPQARDLDPTAHIRVKINRLPVRTQNNYVRS